MLKYLPDFTYEQPCYILKDLKWPENVDLPYDLSFFYTSNQVKLFLLLHLFPNKDFSSISLKLDYFYLYIFFWLRFVNTQILSETF